MNKDNQNRTRQMGAFITIPFVMAVPPIVGWYIGTLLDDIFGTSPYLMFVVLILGVAGGIKECYRIIKTFSSEE